METATEVEAAAWKISLFWGADESNPSKNLFEENTPFYYPDYYFSFHLLNYTYPFSKPYVYFFNF